MKCIFCKCDSSQAKSIEHIIPESLGNKGSILPRGAVCDRCNNYFATKIEKRVLESGEFQYLRFHQSIKNKAGRTPEIEGFIGPHKVKFRAEGWPFQFNFILSEDSYDALESYLKTEAGRKASCILIPESGQPAENALISRWLAKMALEALAHRISKNENWNEAIVEDAQFDPIRQFARFAKRGECWDYSKRKIYDDYSFKLHNGEMEQILLEWDLLLTEPGECTEVYFVLAVFGTEYAINVAGSSMYGYSKWLESNSNKSPLYAGKNADSTFPTQHSIRNHFEKVFSNSTPRQQKGCNLSRNAVPKGSQ